jgi:hypothetical protein
MVTAMSNFQNIQIFLSYSRDDDVAPPFLPQRNGFVSSLFDQLTYEFTNKGPSRPSIWRDQREIGRAEQFDQKIEDAIKSSALLVVVLSENWLSRPYCWRELESFAKHWVEKGESHECIRGRITVVSKRHVAVKQRPALLQGQESFQFYSLERVGGEERDREFFKNGERRDPRYVDRIEELAAHLCREAARYGLGDPAPPDSPIEASSLKSFTNNRTIYLAKPASDMIEAYDRLTRELTGRGYRVVPHADDEIPDNPSALQFVEEALKSAEMSIHLLGEKSGCCPEELPPIVKLQLELAAEKVAADSSGRFHRLIWAPEQLTQNASPAANSIMRDPFQVLARFHRQLTTDRISGKALSLFVDFVGQHLMRVAPAIEKRPQIPVDSSVYINHYEGDEAYAIALKSALEERNVDAELPAFGGSDVEIRNYHLKKLRECNAVALCWAHASEVWVRSQTDELKNWRQLGRKEPFSFRGVVTGPPPDRRKRNVKQLFPRSAIDIVVDLEDSELPLPELLDSLIPQAKPTQGAGDGDKAAVSGAAAVLLS